MASGAASIAMAAGGVLDYGRNGDNVRLVSPEASLLPALDELLIDERARRHLAAGGRATAETRTWAAVDDELVRQYRGAMTRGAAYRTESKLPVRPVAQTSS